MAEEFLRQLPADAHPHLAEPTVRRVLRPGYDRPDAFGFGLELVLEGLARVRASSG